MALKLKQKQLAELMALEPELRNIDYCEKIDINEKTLYRWKKNEEFMTYLHECCQERFKDLEKLAIKKLKENVNKGNQKSIEYVLNYMGYEPEQKLDIKSREIVINITGEEDD